MSTGTEIITDALQRIGVHSAAQSASDEAIETGRRQLNSMLEAWLTQDIRIGYTPLKVAGDELNETADARNAIVNNLAVRLGPDFDNAGAVVGPALVAQANSDYHMIRRHYQVLSIPKKKVSGNLPRGEGNMQHQYGDYDRIFFGQDDELSDG